MHLARSRARARVFDVLIHLQLDFVHVAKPQNPEPTHSLAEMTSNFGKLAEH